MKHKILICGVGPHGTSDVSHLKEKGFNDVVIVAPEDMPVIKKEVLMPIVNTIIPFDDVRKPLKDLFPSKLNRKGGKKNKKNWKY